MAVQESWLKYETLCALVITSLVVHSHFMDVFPNGSAEVRLVIGRMAEAEYVSLSLCAFLQAV